MSHDVDGAVVGHLFDDGTNKLVGHAAWAEVKDPGDSYDVQYTDDPPIKLSQEDIERAVELALIIIGGIIEATPHVVRWWRVKAVPGARHMWAKIPMHWKKAETVDVTDTVETTDALAVPEPPKVEQMFVVEPGITSGVAVIESPVTMSSQEWVARFQAMVAVGAFKDEQMRILSNARIAADTASIEGQSADSTELTAEQFAGRIVQMLEANPSLLEDETTTEFVRVFAHKPRQAKLP